MVLKRPAKQADDSDIVGENETQEESTSTPVRTRRRLRDRPKRPDITQEDNIPQDETSVNTSPPKRRSSLAKIRERRLQARGGTLDDSVDNTNHEATTDGREGDGQQQQDLGEGGERVAEDNNAGEQITKSGSGGGEDNTRSEVVTSNVEEQALGTDATPSIEGKQSVRGEKGKGKRAEKQQTSTVSPSKAQDVQEEKPKLSPPLQNLFCVKVHKSEALRPDVYMTHPVVCVHMVNILWQHKTTGEYLKKGDVTRPVATRFECITSEDLATGERKSKPCDFILPIMTQPCPLKMKGSGSSSPMALTNAPSWEEELLWNEDAAHIITPETILLFEILDFGPRLPFEQLVDGWLPVAWAFLIPHPNVTPQGAQGAAAGSPLRLQLFSYPSVDSYRKFMPLSLNIPRIFMLWASNNRVRYPATFYSSVYSIPPPPTPLASTLRPFTPLDNQFFSKPWVQSPAADGSGPAEATGTPSTTTTDPSGNTTNDNSNNDKPEEVDHSGIKKALTVRRDKDQPTLIPDTILYKLDSGSRGCFGLQFSHSGQFLVGLCADLAMFPLKIYDVYTSKCIQTFSGHHDMVYGIEWGDQDDCLLTSSSDGTAKLWLLPKGGTATATLPVTYQHTCFVYCAQFHPTASSPRVVVTGAYDGMIRLWDQDSAKLLYEVSGHKSHVNSIAFEKSGERLFSGDGIGMIYVWNARGAGLSLLKVVAAFNGSPINTIKVHPSGRRLLVHTRNSSIHSVDARFFTVISTFTNLVNVEWPIKASYSACGKYIASGSENGKIVIYDEESRTIVHTYIGANFGLAEPVTSIEWHPVHHILALCAFGPRVPILVFAHNLDGKGTSQLKPDQKLLAAQKARMDLADKIIAPPPPLPSGSRSTLPPLSPAPTYVNKNLQSTVSLPPLTPPLPLSNSNFYTKNSLIPPTTLSASSALMRSSWLQDELFTTSPLRTSRLAPPPPQQSSDDLRRSQKKFRRKRREATLTQIRKERGRFFGVV